MRALSVQEIDVVSGAGKGQEIAQCMVDEGVKSGWVGIGLTLASFIHPGLGAAYFGGLLVGCTIVTNYQNGC